MSVISQVWSSPSIDENLINESYNSAILAIIEASTLKDLESAMTSRAVAGYDTTRREILEEGYQEVLKQRVKGVRLFYKDSRYLTTYALDKGDAITIANIPKP